MKTPAYQQNTNIPKCKCKLDGKIVNNGWRKKSAPLKRLTDDYSFLNSFSAKLVVGGIFVSSKSPTSYMYEVMFILKIAKPRTCTR